MKSHKLRAIVLRRTNFGEADRVIQVITPIGKRSVMAKGVRKEKSRLGAGIEPFAINEIVVGEGKGDLDVLTSARLVTFFRHILEDYSRLQFGYQAVKLVSSGSETPDPEWYELLAETLAGLDSKTLPQELTETWFYLRYAALMGYGLSLWMDVNGKELLSNQRYRYDETEKGFVASDGGDISADHIKLMRLISTKSLKVLAQIGGVNEVLLNCVYVARQHAGV